MNLEQIAKFTPLKEKLEQSQTIAIFGHQSIDGDALGSMYGLGKQLEKMGKQVRYFTPDAPGHQFSFLNLSSLEFDFDYGEYDALVLVDMAHPSRIMKFYEGHESYFDREDLVIFDHHLPDINKLSLKTELIARDDTSIANCENIFEITSSWWDLIDAEIATFLYTGIVTDSGNFCNDEGTESQRVMKNAVKLLELGADKKAVVVNVLQNKTLKEIEFMQLILKRMQHLNNTFYSWYSLEELDLYDIHKDEAEYGLSIMRGISEGELFILGKEIESGEKLKISLRGKGKYNCRDLAAHFDGGGHFNAAGCTIESTGTLEEDMEDFVFQLQNML